MREIRFCIKNSFTFLVLWGGAFNISETKRAQTFLLPKSSVKILEIVVLLVFNFSANILVVNLSTTYTIITINFFHQFVCLSEFFFKFNTKFYICSLVQFCFVTLAHFFFYWNNQTFYLHYLLKFSCNAK